MYILLFLLLLSFFFLISFQIMYYLLYIEMVDEIRSQKTLSGNYGVRHGLRTPGEEIAFTARPKIKSQSQCYRYGRSIFQLSHRPKVSDFFDLLMPSLDVRSPWCKVFTRQLYLVILDMQAPIRILESIYGKPFFFKNSFCL